MKALIIDLETDSLNKKVADVVGFAWATFDTDKQELSEIRYQLKFSDDVIELITNPDILKIAYNIKFEYQKLLNYGLELKGSWFDPMIALWLCQKGVAKDDYTGKKKLHYGLKDIASTYLNYTVTDDFKELSKKYGTKSGRKLIPAVASQIPSDILCEYCKKDIKMTFDAYKLASSLLTKHELNKVFEKIEMPCTRIIADMEYNGIRLDIQYLENLKIELNMEIANIVNTMNTYSSSQINWSSTKDLRNLLFNELKLPCIVKTPSGEASTSSEALEKLLGKHPIIELIMKYREFTKMMSTYVQGWLDEYDYVKDRYFFDIWQTGTDTGRVSSNLQQIPKKSELGLRIRKAVIPEDKMTLISADYSQMDLRILAHVSQDENLIKAFKNGEDLHQSVADILGLEGKEGRQKAKSVNFGLVYGKSPFGFAKDWNCSIDEAQEFLDRYFKKFYGIKSWMEKQKAFVRLSKYSKTLCGRKRFISDDINLPIAGTWKNGKYWDINKFKREAAERIALNSPIQGGTADVTKLAMIKSSQELSAKIKNSRLIQQIHDELWFEVPTLHTDEAIGIIKQAMESVINLKNVPLLAKVKKGV